MRAKPVLADEADRLAIREDLDSAILVEAAAGTGKTTALVGRIVGLLRKGKTTIESIAAITFTVKAAAHLRQEVQVQLEKAFAEENHPEQKARLSSALDGLGKAFVGTIHSFCGRLIRERPVEAGIDPAFEELDETENAMLRDAFWSEFCQRLIVEGDPRVAKLDELGVELTDLGRTFRVACEYPDVQAVLAKDPARADFAAARSSIASFLDRALSALPNAIPAKGWDTLQTLVRRCARLRNTLDLTRDVEFVRFLEVLSKNATATQNRWPDKKVAKDLGDDFRHLQDNLILPGLRAWREFLHPTLFGIIQSAADEFQSTRISSGRLNYQDLLMEARALLRDHAEVRGYFQGRFPYVLVDEFQDTDPIQAEVMFYLTGKELGEKSWTKLTLKPGALFIVGDPKQSIYRFRRADIATYAVVKRLIQAQHGKVLMLTTNFRSVANLCGWANATFTTRFPAAGTPEQAAFAPFSSIRAEDRDYGGVFRLETVSDHANTAMAILSHADLVADWVRGALDGKWKITEQDKKGTTKERVPQPGDFLVLLRYTKHLSVYARALELRGIPFEVSGADAFAESDELFHVLTCAKAVVDPDDPVTLVHFLRGPLCGIDDEALYLFKTSGGRLNYLSPLAESADPRLKRAFALLAEIRDASRRLPPGAVWEMILDRLGIVAYGAAMDMGETRAGNLLKSLMVARKGSTEGANFEEIVESVEGLIENGGVEAMSSEPGRANAVRLMNLHKAKGLEAPIVFLADPSEPPTHEPDYYIERIGESAHGYFLLRYRQGYVDRELARPLEWDTKAATEAVFQTAEETRLLYVAATRAKNMLVISLHRKQLQSGEERLLGPWLELRGSIDRSLPPLPASKTAPQPIPGSNMLTQFQRAREQRPIQVATVSSPGYALARVTQIAKGGAEPVVRAGGRGPEWGSALHRVLEATLRDPDLNLEEHATAALQEQKLAAELQGELVELVTKCRKSDLWARAMRSSRRFTEVPFALKVKPEDLGLAATPSEVILNGVIDLVFKDKDGWTVADYKSEEINDNLPQLIAAYRLQVHLYVKHWQQIVGEPTKGLLFFIANQQACPV